MKKRKIEYILGLLVFVAFLAGLATAFTNPNRNFIKTPILKSKVDNIILQATYEREAAGILQTFSADYAIGDEQTRKTVLSTTKDKLLALRVPAVDKDIHLTIIIALTDLEKGNASTNTNIEEIKTGISLFNGTVQSVPWLSSVPRIE